MSQSKTPSQLLTHSFAVAIEAKRLAEPLHLDSYAEDAGLLHDLGKATDAYRKHVTDNAPAPEHAAAGAAYLAENDPVAAYAVAGHHTGLPDGGTKAASILGGSLNAKINRFNDAPKQKLDEIVINTLLSKRPEIKDFTHCPPDDSDPKDKEFFSQMACRLVASCLFAADAKVSAIEDGTRKNNKTPPKSKEKTTAELINHLSAYASKFGIDSKKLNTSLRSVADREKGVFTQISNWSTPQDFYVGLVFSALHAYVHNLERIVIVTPTIVAAERIAEITKAIFPKGVVSLNHSAVSQEDETNESKLAWEYPISITTHASMTLSLLSGNVSHVRNLRGLANAVIIVSDPWAMDPETLTPTLRSLAELINYFGSSVFFASSFETNVVHPMMSYGLQPIEVTSPLPTHTYLIDDIDVKDEGVLNEKEVADLIRKDENTLCIVSDKRRARRIADLLPENAAIVSGAVLPKDRLNNLSARPLMATHAILGVFLEEPVSHIILEKEDLEEIVWASHLLKDGRGKITLFTPSDSQKGTFKRSLIETCAPNIKDVLQQASVIRYQVLLRDLQNTDRFHIMELAENPYNRLQKIPFRKITQKVTSFIQNQNPTIIETEKSEEYVKDLLVSRMNWDLYQKIRPYTLWFTDNEIYELKNRVHLIGQTKFYRLMDKASYSPRLGLKL